MSGATDGERDQRKIALRQSGEGRADAMARQERQLDEIDCVGNRIIQEQNHSGTELGQANTGADNRARKPALWGWNYSGDGTRLGDGTSQTVTRPDATQPPGT